MHCAQCVSASSTGKTATTGPHTAAIPHSCQPANAADASRLRSLLCRALQPCLLPLSARTNLRLLHIPDLSLCGRTTWNDAFLCLIKAQPHSPGCCREPEDAYIHLARRSSRRRPTHRAAMPGFDYKFLEKPKRRFQCPLCSKAMREPVQVSTCGHRFCDTCLQEFLRYALCLCAHMRQAIPEPVSVERLSIMDV